MAVICKAFMKLTKSLFCGILPPDFSGWALRLGSGFPVVYKIVIMALVAAKRRKTAAEQRASRCYFSDRTAKKPGFPRRTRFRPLLFSGQNSEKQRKHPTARCRILSRRSWHAGSIRVDFFYSPRQPVRPRAVAARFF
jgi:hypothetical protein